MTKDKALRSLRSALKLAQARNDSEWVALIMRRIEEWKRA